MSHAHFTWNLCQYKRYYSPWIWNKLFICLIVWSTEFMCPMKWFILTCVYLVLFYSLLQEAYLKIVSSHASTILYSRGRSECRSFEIQLVWKRRIAHFRESASASAVQMFSKSFTWLPRWVTSQITNKYMLYLSRTHSVGSPTEERRVLPPVKWKVIAPTLDPQTNVIYCNSC